MLSLFFVIVIFKIFFAKPNFSEFDYTNANFKVLGLNLPKELDFSGELVPQNDYKIKENLELEFFSNKSWKTSSRALFFKAKKWFPIIEPILKKEGIPDDFKYVAIIESHLENVVSPMGAAGFWQLMPETAQNYGLVINEDVDERYDVEKSTRIACKHFKDGYKYFHNWTLSAAAYNIGIGGIQKALKNQDATNYYDLILNKETASFVYRILAYKTLLSNPEHFGFNLKRGKSSAFPDFKTVTVDSSITNLKYFAKHIETDIPTLKIFNPWLLGDKLNNPDKHSFTFKIPKNKNVDLSAFLNDGLQVNIPSTSNLKPTSTDSLGVIKNDTLKK